MSKLTWRYLPLGNKCSASGIKLGVINFMPHSVHFISGLPRSGSTLLAAILKQNPRFHAAMTSPVASLWGALLPKMGGGSEFGGFFDDERRAKILRGVLSSYYAETDCEVLFDTNRTWSGRMALTRSLYPNSKIICCVREIGPIIDSVERMLRKNPLQTSRIFNFKQGSSVYARVDILMNSASGLVGAPWSTLREAWFGDDSARLIIIKYDTLVSSTLETIERLYDILGESLFKHDFESIRYEQIDYDAHLGMPGMHTVNEGIRAVSPDLTIPPDIISKYADASFWNRPLAKHSNISIL